MADSGRLFADHGQRVFRYFCRAVGQAETARDLTQEVFLRATRELAPTTGDGRAWLFRVARNLALDFHRTRARNPDPAPLADAPTRPASQDVRAAVREALATLPSLDRDVFLMREVAGLGYEEIAQACELTPDAVRSRIHRTRLELRTRLAAPIAAFHTAPVKNQLRKEP
jgi:RNA polymerase sigma-70 factor (ECF subfamily)